MKKLTLELDSLRVDSFEPSPAQQRSRGTVQAREYTQLCNEDADYISKVSCPGTCAMSQCYGNSCGGLCTYTCESWVCDPA
jgi:hypothetical protein